MLDNNTIQQAQKRVQQYIQEGSIRSKQPPKHVEFFATNATQSLKTAQLLFDVSTQETLQKATGYLQFNGYLWVINASYYSMFYLAQALLEHNGIIITSEQSRHARTIDALIYYFYINGKLQKEIIETYAESLEEADELLGKAEELITAYHHERIKRAKFTYEIGTLAMQSKAHTDIQYRNTKNPKSEK